METDPCDYHDLHDPLEYLGFLAIKHFGEAQLNCVSLIFFSSLRPLYSFLFV